MYMVMICERVEERVVSMASSRRKESILYKIASSRHELLYEGVHCYRSGNGYRKISTGFVCPHLDSCERKASNERLMANRMVRCPY